MRRVVAAVAAVLVLGACSDDPTPQFEADPSESPSVTPTPDEPEPWEEKSDEGAIAFVEHWVDTFNKMRDSLDTRELASLSSPNCESCANFVSVTNQIRKSGGYIQTKGWTVESVSVPAEANSETPMMGLRVDQAPQVLLERADGEEQRFSGGKADFVARLEWTSGRWLMTRLDIS